jgi:hypothetical protein
VGDEPIIASKIQYWLFFVAIHIVVGTFFTSTIQKNADITGPSSCTYTIQGSLSITDTLGPEEQFVVQRFPLYIQSYFYVHSNLSGPI